MSLAVATGCGGGSAEVEDAPTTVFARQARELAVGVAATRQGERVGVTTTVLARDGTGARGLRVALASGGAWVGATPCGPGRYCGELPVSGARPQVQVRLTRPAGRMSTVFVRLPRDPQPERAGALVRDAGRALRGLNSLIVNEHLTSGPPYEPLLTQFVYVAPDRFSYRTSGSGDAVVIGARRWDRQGPKSPWVLSIQEPSRVPAPDWRRVAHPSVLGSGRTAGRPVWRVSFYDPSVPAWFEADLDRATGLPLELWMVAAAHFMRHVYGAFNAPLVVLPPTASTATG